MKRKHHYSSAVMIVLFLLVSASIAEASAFKKIMLFPNDAIRYHKTSYSDRDNGDGQSVCVLDSANDSIRFDYTLKKNRFCELMQGIAKINPPKRNRFLDSLFKSGYIDSLGIRETICLLRSCNFFDSCCQRNRFAFLQRNMFAGVAFDFRNNDAQKKDSITFIPLPAGYDSIRIVLGGTFFRSSIKVQLKTWVDRWSKQGIDSTYVIREAEILITGVEDSVFTLSIDNDFKTPDYMIPRIIKDFKNAKEAFNKEKLFGISIQTGSETFPADANMNGINEIRGTIVIKKLSAIASEPVTCSMTQQGQSSIESHSKNPAPSNTTLIRVLSVIILCQFVVILFFFAKKAFKKSSPSKASRPGISSVKTDPPVPVSSNAGNEIVEKVVDLIENNHNDFSLDLNSISDRFGLSPEMSAQITIAHQSGSTSKAMGIPEYLHTIRFEKEVDYLVMRDGEKIIAATAMKQITTGDLEKVPEPPEISHETVQKIMHHFRNNYYYPSCSPDSDFKHGENEHHEHASSAISDGKIAASIDLDPELAKARLRDFIGEYEKMKEEGTCWPLCRYLKVLRLSIARKILEKVRHEKISSFILQNLPVHLGYGKYQTFSGDFKKMFGIAPKDLL